MKGCKERFGEGLWMISKLQSKELIEYCKQSLINHSREVQKITELRDMGTGENWLKVSDGNKDSIENQGGCHLHYILAKKLHALCACPDNSNGQH